MNYTSEVLATRERKVFGEHEPIMLPVDAFVRLPQVRTGMNPELPNLKDSIRTRGLINPVDVARMSAEQLQAYIEFVNQTWGTTVSLDDYAQKQQDDSYYYVVVAGHTRIEAIHQLQQEDQTSEYMVMAKVHPVSDPQEIISLQLDENLHSKPAQEQRAIAIVESYQYGLQHGLWKNKTEFLAESRGKFSRQILNDAIGFAQLPEEARDFVFSGRLSYNAAVALGSATDTIMEYVAIKLGYYYLPVHSTPAFKQAYHQEVGLLIAGITNRSLNGTAAKKFISGRQSVLAQQTAILRGDSESESEAAMFELAGHGEQSRVYLRRLEQEYRAALRQMRDSSVEAVADALQLHRRLAGNEGIDGLEKERRERLQLLASRATELSLPTAG